MPAKQVRDKRRTPWSPTKVSATPQKSPAKGQLWAAVPPPVIRARRVGRRVPAGGEVNNAARRDLNFGGAMM